MKLKGPVTFRGACDASAAVTLDGTTCFVTASDEDYLLRVYDRTAPGPPIATIDVTDFLAPANHKKEADLEGAAPVGSRIFWIGSHGRDKDGVEQESRQRLFATAVASGAAVPVISPTGVPYAGLLRDLIQSNALANFDLRRASSRPPEQRGGLSIEGLAAADNGELLIGFRNPIPEGKALIVRLHNPADLVDGRSASAVVSVGAHLDLGGRGIRALEYLPKERRYLVIAGAFDDTRDFKMFAWRDGDQSAEPLEVPELDPLNPEELIAVAAEERRHELWLLSDDGDAVVAGTKCKKLEDGNARGFRAHSFRLTL